MTHRIMYAHNILKNRKDMHTGYVTVKDTDAPGLAPYRSLKVRHPDKDGIFIVESKPAVLQLLKSGLETVSCLTTKKYIDDADLLPYLQRSRSFPVYIMAKDKIEDIIGFRFHHGIMMAARSPAKRSLAETKKYWHTPHTLLALNGIHDPQNVGLITRNAAAFGVDTMIVDGGTYEPFYRKVARISMGSVFNVPIAYEPDLSGPLARLKEESGTRLIVTSPDPAHPALNKADLSGNICLVMGNEAYGAGKEIFRIADLTVSIPIFFDKADSLNVACASAVALYEIVSRNRHKT